MSLPSLDALKAAFDQQRFAPRSGPAATRAPLPHWTQAALLALPVLTD